MCSHDSNFPRAAHTQEHHHHRITASHDFRVRRNYSCHHPHLPILHIFHFQGKLGHNKVEELGQYFVASQLPNKISKIFAFVLLHSSKGWGRGGLWPLNRADRNKQRLAYWNLDLTSPVWWVRVDSSSVRCTDREDMFSCFDHENTQYRRINAAPSATTTSPANFWVPNKCQYLNIWSQLL